jgi:hypothetical protein
VVKWGDEAVIPSRSLAPSRGDEFAVDAVRFGWLTEPTVELAREKEWLVFDRRSRLVRAQLSRQPLESLRRQLQGWGMPDAGLAVNLGSVAVSYRMLDAALDVFHEELADPARKVDWDPYVWMALHASEEEWAARRSAEAATGGSGIEHLERSIPDFFRKLTSVREKGGMDAKGVQSRFLDFGEPLWVDLGLHASLRRNLELLTQSGDGAAAMRDVFNVSHERDARGNTIVDSDVHPLANVTNSLIVRSTVKDPASVVTGGVICGSRIGRAHMPAGGAVLWSAIDDLRLDGPHCVCLRSVAASVVLSEGGRHATLCLPDERISLATSESIVDYSGDNYEKPMGGNRFSFQRAGEVADGVGAAALQESWAKAWAEGR